MSLLRIAAVQASYVLMDRDATIERVREWLGTDVDGHHHLRADEDGRLSLSEAVAVDWSRRQRRQCLVESVA